MRPILIMPRPKVSEVAIAERRRLNELDSKREAIELDEEGAVIDDLEERRKRWRRWCGLSKVIVMQSAEPVVIGHNQIAPPASLQNCENLIEMLLRRRRLSLPTRVRANSKRLLELRHPATTLAFSDSHNEVVDQYAGGVAVRSGRVFASRPQRGRSQSRPVLAERGGADEALRILFCGSAACFHRISGQ